MPLGHYVSDLFLCSDISQYGDLVFNIHNFVEDHIEAGKCMLLRVLNMNI